MREVRDALVRQRREELEGKQQRANILRSSHLQEIVRKAQEEDAKVDSSIGHLWVYRTLAPSLCV